MGSKNIKHSPDDGTNHGIICQTFCAEQIPRDNIKDNGRAAENQKAVIGAGIGDGIVPGTQKMQNGCLKKQHQNGNSNAEEDGAEKAESTDPPRGVIIFFPEKS